jgi:TolB protein
VSPNGKTMAMSLVSISQFQTGWRMSRHFDRALAVSDLLGTGITLLGAGSDPSWSPDGTRIAFSRVSAGHAHLFVVNADGTEPRQLTEGASDDVAPTWSPDGRFIVFCSAHGDAQWTQSNLFAMRADGSGLVQLTEGDFLSGRPAWAKDGFVYFHTNASDRFHIWRLRLASAGS